MPSPPDTQVYEYVFPIEGTDYHFFYVTGEDVAYLADRAGNSYAVGGIRPAPVSYTHLGIWMMALAISV